MTSFSFWLMRLGIAVSHGRPLHPQTQGKVERFHRTMKSELLSTQSWPTLAAAQAGFDSWRATYNHERPHEALGLQPPSQHYALSPRPFPEILPPIEYSSDDQVRAVHGGGQISFRGRLVYVSQALMGQQVALKPTTTQGVFHVFYCHHFIGALDLTGSADSPIRLHQPGIEV